MSNGIDAHKHILSDLDELAKNHAIQPDDLEDYTQCCDCGGWIHPDDTAHMAGWKSGKDGSHQWRCEDCESKQPDVIAAREREAAWDRKDGK